jgi:hypothetical protein
VYQEGMTIATVPTTRMLVNSVNPAIKSLNYLNNILARIEANLIGVEEAIMLNSEGYVAECTGDNIFIVQKGKLYTPPLSAGALYGITRNTVIECAKNMGIQVGEPNLTRYDIYTADEMFLTGTAAEMVPVVKVDGRVIGVRSKGGMGKADGASVINGHDQPFPVEIGLREDTGLEQRGGHRLHRRRSQVGRPPDVGQLRRIVVAEAAEFDHAGDSAAEPSPASRT